MLNIAIVEDEKTTRDEIFTFIKKYEKENNLNIKMTLFDDGTDILYNYEAIYDIIFMDIKMKHMDGMIAAEEIRKLDEKVQIVFITSMANYAIKGYEVGALDFLLKPVYYDTFSLKLTKAINVVNKNAVKKYILLPFEDSKMRVSTDDILFIEVNGHILKFVTQDKDYFLRSTLGKIQDELKDFNFSRCNNSYIVNLKKVSTIEKDNVIIDKYTIPISRPKKKDFLRELSNFIMGGY
ncbi:MAG: LytR/AlgR family response regulator transcription factor [Lachnospirales bacterium]